MGGPRACYSAGGQLGGQAGDLPEAAVPPAPQRLRVCPLRRGGGRLPFFCSPWSPRGACTPEMGARGHGACEAVRVAGSAGQAGAGFPICSGRLQTRRAPCVDSQENKSTETRG